MLSALWVGLLAGVFLVAGWVRRRWPDVAEWRPRPAPDARFNRIWGGVGLLAAGLGTFVLIRPDIMLDVVSGGRAVPAYEAFTLGSDFLRWGAPAVLSLLAVQLSFLAYLVVRGRRDARSRQVELVLSIVTIAVLTAAVVARKLRRRSVGVRVQELA